MIYKCTGCEKEIRDGYVYVGDDNTLFHMTRKDNSAYEILNPKSCMWAYISTNKSVSGTRGRVIDVTDLEEMTLN